MSWEEQWVIYNSLNFQVSSAGNKMIRERRRVAKILLGLGLLFAGCWLPYSVTSLYLDSNAKDPPGINEEIRDFNSKADESNDQIIYYANLLLPYFILLGHCQAALNPLLYFFLSKIFRKCVQNFIRHPIKILLTRPENRVFFNMHLKNKIAQINLNTYLFLFHTDKNDVWKKPCTVYPNEIKKLRISSEFSSEKPPYPKNIAKDHGHFYYKNPSEFTMFQKSIQICLCSLTTSIFVWY